MKGELLQMRDDERVAKTMTEFLNGAGYNVPYEDVLGALQQGLSNGPEYTYGGQVYRESYVLYVP